MKSNDNLHFQCVMMNYCAISYITSLHSYPNASSRCIFQGYFGAVGAFLENVGYTDDRSPSPDMERKQTVTKAPVISESSSKEQLTNGSAENHIEGSTAEDVSL